MLSYTPSGSTIGPDLTPKTEPGTSAVNVRCGLHAAATRAFAHMRSARASPANRSWTTPLSNTSTVWIDPTPGENKNNKSLVSW